MVIRYLALWFLFLIGTAASAQKEERSMGVFIRVYDLQGKKMAKGNLVAVSQEMLQIDHLDSLVTIAAVDIGKIKTHRSFGGHMLKGSLIGFSIGSFLIAGDTEGVIAGPGNSLQAVVAVTGGVAVGGAIGAGSILFSKRRKFEIQGDPNALDSFYQLTQK